MSFYSFATSNFTTSDDRHRRPAIDNWQIVRTLAFVLVVFVGFACAARHGQTEAPDRAPPPKAAT